MTNRYGSANGRGRRLTDVDDEAIDKAFTGPRGNLTRAIVNRGGVSAARMSPPKQAQRATDAIASVGRKRRMSEQWNPATNDFRASFSGNVKKARHYDPESRRQQGLGVAIAATGGVGGALAFRGGRGIARSTRALSGIRATGASGKAEHLEAGREELKHLGTSVHARQADVRNLGLGLGGLGTAGVISTHANSRRGRPYN